MTRQEDRRTMEAMLAAIRDAIHQETALQVAGLNAASLPEENQTEHNTPAESAENEPMSANGLSTPVAETDEPATIPQARQPAPASATEHTPVGAEDLLAEPLALEALLDESLQDLVTAEPDNADEIHAPSGQAPANEAQNSERDDQENFAASPADTIPPTAKASLQGANTLSSQTAPFAPSRSSTASMTGKSGYASPKGGIADILSGKIKAAPSARSTRPMRADMAGKSDACMNPAAKPAGHASSRPRSSFASSATEAADDSWRTFSKPRKAPEAASNAHLDEEPPAPDDDARLLNTETAQRARAAFDRLRRGHAQNGNTSANLGQKMLAALDEEEIQALVLKALRPMLRDWLNTHLPALVERLVREEIARIAHGASDKDQGRGA